MKDICALIDQTEPLDISAKFCTQLRQIYGPALTSKNKKTLERTIRSFREKSGSQVFNAVFIYALFAPEHAMVFARQRGVFCYANEWSGTTFCLQKLSSAMNVLALPKKEQLFICQKLKCIWLESFYQKLENRIRKNINAHHKHRLRKPNDRQVLMESNLVVELLAYVNHYFQSRTDDEPTQSKSDTKIEQDMLAEFSKEEVTEAVSYLIYLCNELNMLPSSEKVSFWMDSEYLISTKIQDLILLACQKLAVAGWEIEADCLCYQYTSQKNILTIFDSDGQLKKSITLGFIRTENAERSQAADVFTQEVESLAESAMKFSCKHGREIFCWDETIPYCKRYRMNIPAAYLNPFLPNNFAAPKLYKEEQGQLECAAAERMLTAEQFSQQLITEHCTFMDLLLFKRFFTLLTYAQRFLLSHERDPKKVMVSLVPVMPELQLLDLVSRFLGDGQKAREMIAHFTWDGQKKLDLQYTPIVKANDHRMYVTPEILASSNLLRNSVLLDRMRNEQSLVNPNGIADPLEVLCEKSFSRCSYPFGTKPNSSYCYNGNDGEIDYLVWDSDHLFVFECKNTILPSSSHELRTTYDAIQKALHQLDQAQQALNDHVFCQTYFPRWNIPLKSYSIHTCILLGNRLFAAPNGLRHPVRYAYDLDAVLNINGQADGYWCSDHFTVQDLIRFLSDEDTFLNSFTDNMEPYYKGIQTQGKMFRFQSYYLKCEIPNPPSTITSTEQVPNFCSERESPEDMRAFSKERAESCGDSAPERTWRSHGPQSPAALR